jgi:hypothetical protein
VFLGGASGFVHVANQFWLTWRRQRASMSHMRTKTAATKSPDATKKLLTYDTLSSFNRGFTQILQNLQRL